MTPKEKFVERSATAYADKCTGNENDHYNTKLTFIHGAQSDAAKEFHTKGMYTEEEVRRLVWEARIFYHEYSHLPFSFIGGKFNEWFEQNKKH